MTTDAQTTLLHAAELLEAEALVISSLRKDGIISQNALQDKFEDLHCTALELRLLARSIHAGHAAVPPAPTIEGERK